MLIDNLKRLSKDSLIYGLGGVAQFFISLFLIPVYTRIFTPADYGILDTVSTLASILALFFSLGLNSATQRYYFDHPEDGNLIISTAFWFLALFNIFFSALLILFSPILSKLLFSHLHYSNLIAIGIASLPFTLLTGFIKDTLRLKFSSWKYNIISLSEVLLGISIISLLVIILKKGILGNFLGSLITSIVIVAISIFTIKSNIIFRFSKQYVKKLLTFGIPLVFAGFAYWVINLSDRIFLLKLSTLNQLGIYSIGNKISSLMLLPITALQLAWAPLIFQKYKEEHSDKFVSKSLTYVWSLFIILAVCLTFFSPDVLRILTPSAYFKSARVVGMLALSLAFFGISGILSIGVTLAKKTKFITISSVISAIINIVFNIILIPSWGMYGAAFSTLLSYACLCVCYYYFSQKYYHFPYEQSKILKILLIGTMYILLASFFSIQSAILSIFLKIAVIISLILILYLTIPDTEEKNVLQLYGKKLSRYIFRKITFINYRINK